MWTFLKGEMIKEILNGCKLNFFVLIMVLKNSQEVNHDFACKNLILAF